MALIPGAVGSAPSFPAGSGDVQFYAPSISTDLILDTSYAAGRMLTFINSGTANLVLKALDGSVIRTVYPQTDGRVVPIQNSPAVTAHWAGIGPVSSNWVAYTPTVAGLGAGASTNTGSWRRNSDSVQQRFALVKTGGAGSGAAIFDLSLVPGLTADTTKWPNGGGVAAQGFAQLYSIPTNLTNAFTGVLFQSGFIRVWKPGAFVFLTGADFLANSEMYLEVTIPISGWTATKG